MNHKLAKTIAKRLLIVGIWRTYNRPHWYSKATSVYKREAFMWWNPLTWLLFIGAVYYYFYKKLLQKTTEGRKIPKSNIG